VTQIRACGVFHSITDQLVTITPDVYYVGNSLLRNSYPEETNGISSQRGDTWTAGMHYRSGRSMEYIYAYPADFTLIIGGFGAWNVALRNNAWDAMIVQSYPYTDGVLGPSTLLDDQVTTLALITEAQALGLNANIRVFIYESWPDNPSTSGVDYMVYWDQYILNLDTQQTRRRRYYYRYLLDRVRALTAQQVFLIPTAEAMYNLHRRFIAGMVPGYTKIDDIYQDQVHVNYVGRFLDAVCVYCSIMGEDPHGLTVPAGGQYDGAYSAELLEAIYDSVWEAMIR